MLRIHGLTGGAAGAPVLRNFNLHVPPGEIHALMGPNGAGKSTLAHLLAGKSGYAAESGSMLVHGHELTGLPADARARAGLFLAFQYPPELPGVSCMQFLKTAVGCARKAKGLDEEEPAEFLRRVRATAAKLGVSQDMLKRSVNEGFSGGEKKRFEALQMALLEPKLAVLDETDSGLDIDALRAVAEAVTSMRSPDRSFLVITHYKRLLDYVRPERIHILYRGAIAVSGGHEIAEKLEQGGYAAFGMQEEACIRTTTKREAETV